jgi:hypothetical protein
MTVKINEISAIAEDACRKRVKSGVSSPTKKKYPVPQIFLHKRYRACWRRSDYHHTKDNSSPYNLPQRLRWGVDVKSMLSLTSALDGVGG